MTEDISMDDWSKQYHERMRNDPRPTWDLINSALTADNEDVMWEAISVLWYRASYDVVEAAQQLAESDDLDRRIVAAQILGNGGIEDATYPEETAQLLLKMLGKERVPDVLFAICFSLGGRREERAIPLLVALKDHPMATVRLGVVHGLACQEDERAINALIELSTDEDDEIRDYATFGLGTLVDIDTPKLREALVARLTDSGRDARGEAMRGLAVRKDRRVIEALIQEIGSDSVGSLALEAAAEMEDPSLCPALLRLKSEIGEDEELETALRSCNCE